MLLVRFRRKQRLEQPAPVRDLSDVADFGECRDTFSHDLSFVFTVEYLVDSNGPCHSSVYHAFIIFNWNKDALFIKYQPMFMDDTVEFSLKCGWKVQQIHILTHFRLVLVRQDEWRIVEWIDRSVQVRLRMP